jgi:Xaa-Pro aminopeptidase
MVFCVETPYYELGWTGLQVEDTVEITPAGARFLTQSSRELIVLT